MHKVMNTRFFTWQGNDIVARLEVSRQDWPGMRVRATIDTDKVQVRAWCHCTAGNYAPKECIHAFGKLFGISEEQLATLKSMRLSLNKPRARSN